MNVKIEISDKMLSDLLCTAFEGGVGYWLQIWDYKMPKTRPNLPKDHFWDCRHTWVPLASGGSIICGEMEDECEFTKRRVLNQKAIREGLAIMAMDYPRHFGDFIREADDATTGDVFIQCCLLGKVVYG